MFHPAPCTLSLVLLTTPALSQNPLFEVRGAPGESLGWDVRALADRDGDGLPEVGAFYVSATGACRVLRGSDGSVLTEVLGRPIGDANADGQADRFVAIAGNEFGVASGDAGPLLWSVSFNLNGAPGMTALPYDLGDVDGDARDDLMVNEAWWGNAPPVVQVSVYSGVAELRHAILRARVHLTWKEVLRVVAECPVKDNDEPQPPLPGGQQDGRSKRPA